MIDSKNRKLVPYGVTKAQVQRQREYNTSSQSQSNSSLFAGVKKLFS